MIYPADQVGAAGAGGVEGAGELVERDAAQSGEAAEAAGGNGAEEMSQGVAIGGG